MPSSCPAFSLSFWSFRALICLCKYITAPVTRIGMRPCIVNLYLMVARFYRLDGTAATDRFSEELSQLRQWHLPNSAKSVHP